MRYNQVSPDRLIHELLCEKSSCHLGAILLFEAVFDGGKTEKRLLRYPGGTYRKS